MTVRLARPGQTPDATALLLVVGVSGVLGGGALWVVGFSTVRADVAALRLLGVVLLVLGATSLGLRPGVIRRSGIATKERRRREEIIASIRR